MLPKLKFLIVLVLLGCAGAAYADPPGRVGRLNYAAGAVSFTSAEAQDEWMQAVLNRPLTSGDRLWVDRDGRAEFHVGSTAVRMAGHTAIDVLNLDDDRLQLRLAEGTLNIRVRDLDRDDVIEIATPAAALLLREAGSYRVSIDSQQDVARITVNFGRAELITPGGPLVVPSSQTAVLGAGVPPAFEVAAYTVQDEFDRWSAERDHREDRAVSAKYVSRQMTGYEDLDAHGSWRRVPEYGQVWVPSHVPADWAPYRQGHWTWISPWGWTWIDDAPWGFAPSHYGRWVWLDRHWAWAPGAVVRRPVYAPALVAFVGGAGFSVAASRGPAVGWFPLGWREPFVPWYRASSRHLHNVNVTHVTNVTNVTTVNHANRTRPDAVTVVSQQAFVSSRPAWRERHQIGRDELVLAEVIRNRVPAEPVRASFGPERSGQRPSAELRTREVVGTSPPAAAFTREGSDARERRVFGTRQGESDSPRVRVLSRDGTQLSAPAPMTRSTEAGRSVDDRAIRRLGGGPRDVTRDGRRDERPVFSGSEPTRSTRDEGGASERREQRLRQEAAERAREAQRQGQPQAPRSSSQQMQSPAQTQPPQVSRVVPPQVQQPAVQAQQLQVTRSSPLQVQQPSVQVQQPQVTRSSPPQVQQPSLQAQQQPFRGQPAQARSQSGDELSPAERKAHRQQQRSRND